jgi:hypothetical protein
MYACMQCDIFLERSYYKEESIVRKEWMTLEDIMLGERS